MQARGGARGALTRGVHAVEWGPAGDGPLVPGMGWRWSGRAWRLDGGTAALWLDRPLARADHRPRARRRMARLAIAPRPAEARAEAADAEPPPGGVVLTDGLRLYPARLVEAAGRTVAVFDPLLPPPDTDLWIAACAEAPGRLPRSAPGGLTAGTLVATPEGLRSVETLEPGDMICDAAGAVLPVLWRGETRLSGAELILYPHLRPLRLRAGALGPGRPTHDLLLAPGQRLSLPAPPALGSGPEALVRACDLEDGRAVRRDLGAGSAVYVHLLLPAHTLLTVEGLACDSFHPALADPVALRWHARGLERVSPGLSRQPEAYGSLARPCLGPAEAAMLAAAIATAPAETAAPCPAAPRVMSAGAASVVPTAGT